MKKFLEKIGRYRVILDREGTDRYLERFYLLLKNRKTFPFNIFFHIFLKSDPDGALHDHPWNYITVILKGGYWEIVPVMYMGKIDRADNGDMITERIWRGPGHIRRCMAESFHRIELEEGITPWTMFIPGIRRREWGFDVAGKWVPDAEYLNSMFKEKNPA